MYPKLHPVFKIILPMLPFVIPGDSASQPSVWLLSGTSAGICVSTVCKCTTPSDHLNEVLKSRVAGHSNNRGGKEGNDDSCV